MIIFSPCLPVFFFYLFSEFETIVGVLNNLILDTDSAIHKTHHNTQSSYRNTLLALAALPPAARVAARPVGTPRRPLSGSP